jgi:hypothetical protein
MELGELHRAARHFRTITTRDPSSVPHYEVLSDALVWTDELPVAHPQEWDAIRMVLRHRTCVIIGVDSPFRGWWDLARELFPEWVGFRVERCTASPQLRAFYVAARDKSDREIEKLFSQE